MLDSSRKVVVVGDGMVGKTALLQAYVQDKFDSDYIPTVFETTAKDVELEDGRHITLGLWDTGGQEEFDQIRQLAYPGASLILLCYAVDCRTSLDNIVHTWVGEVRSYCPSIPIMLIGCKSDRRCVPVFSQGGNSRRGTPVIDCVKPDEAEKIRKQIGALFHLECSALNRSNVESVFQLAARFILDSSTDRTRRINVRRILSFNRTKSVSNGGAVGAECGSKRSRISSRMSNLLCMSKSS
ncbi:GTP-binding protein rhoA [Clonorchis sinensis]|uniref:GTP-binding protein rhoA n=2 Tax=Clonorchis sinensis TaxID=79923 RepID=H2KRJ0_CLOSI|nr:GTP-binding protein rhoA [Clonorchis sinensis]GAA32659.1 GTP-binding protein rhoA [Clonorchis sinensis]